MWSDLLDPLQERSISLELASAVTERLAEEGFDPVYGARPLRRAIRQKIVQLWALQLLQGTFHDGDHIVVEVENRHYTFRRERTVPPTAVPVDAGASS